MLNVGLQAQEQVNQDQKTNRWREKEKTYSSNLERLRKTDQNDSIAKYLILLGQLNLDNNNELSDYDYGYELLKEALALVSNQTLKAQCYQAMGDYGRFTLKRTIAIENYTQAENIYQNLGDNYNIAQCIHRRADVMGGTVQWETIIENYEKAITYYKKAGDSTRVASCTSNIGEDYVHLKQYKKGLSQFLKAYDINKNNDNNQYLESHILCEIGKIYMDSTHLTQRDTLFSQPLAFFKSIKNLDGVSYSSLLLAELFFKENKLSKAEKYGIEGLQVALTYGHKLKIIRGYDILTKIYEAKGDFENAFFNYKSFKAYNDSISEQNMLEYMSEMETKYEVDKKTTALAQTEREKNTAQRQRNLIIVFVVILTILLIILWIYQTRLKRSNRLLSQKKSEIEVINIDLEKTVNYKNVLLKEVHHRVKNNLQIICSILEMQIDASGSLRLKEKLQTSIDRIFSMALVHEQLYTEDSQETIDAHGYFNDIVDSIVSSQHSLEKQISVEMDMEEIQLNLKIALPLGMILNELITNAFKYAFTETSVGRIMVSLKSVENYFILLIGDNGKGLDVNASRNNSIGMQLAQDFTTQIGGQLSYEVNKGTHYQIKFPS